jgi:hypothetical protein
MRPEYPVAVGLGVLIFAACNMGSPASPDFSPSSSLNPASGNSSSGATQGGCGGDPTIDAIQQSVFDKGCSFGSCHGGANPAAKLDLSKGHACASLVNQKTCVFSNRTRVVPGHPEQSYLYAKITGNDLGTSPDGPCAGLTNGTPHRMPLGGEPLCQEAIDQVAAWITAGAKCDGSGNPDGGSGDGGTDAQPDSGPQVTSLTVAGKMIGSGQSTTVTLTLSAPAPAPGLSMPIAVTDSSVLQSPGEVFINKGESSITFDVTGARPARASVQVGGAQASVLVTGLSLAELLYIDDYGATTSVQWVKIRNTTSVPIDLGKYSLGAGVGSYTETRSQLTGTLAPGACAVIGGPVSRTANGSPKYAQQVQFTPEVPWDGTGGGIAIFDATAAQLTPTTPPLDTLVYGAGNPGGLLRPDGTVATPDAPDVWYAGDSLLKTPTGWQDTYPTTPNRCP